MTIISEKLLQVTRSVTPIFLFVWLIHFFLVPFSPAVLTAFVLGTVCIVIGLTLFLVGVEIAISPIGDYIGKGIARSNKISILIIVGLILGFMISMAEPSLTVLGNQISLVTNGAIGGSLLVFIVSVGIAVMVVIGLLRIVYTWSFMAIMLASYSIILLLSLFASSEFLSIAFDASGATTGSITVPFLLALSAGISSLKKNTIRKGEDSFGLVAIASAGAVITVLFSNLINPTESLSGDLDVSFGLSGSLFFNLFEISKDQLGDVLTAIAPIAVLFILYQILFLKLPKRRFHRIMLGIVYVITGLLIFLTGVNFGFIDIGSIIGYKLMEGDQNGWFYVLSFILGMVTILAEPAVAVLTEQIERVTAGALKPVFVLTALSVGVGTATLLAALRVTSASLELWHILLPGYLLVFVLSYFNSNTIVTMAFDAGGVASGPMTATFILGFIQGAAEGAEGASVLIDGFGMIAIVAMTPILTIQLFGLADAYYKNKSKQ
ncbi:DUF1538 domain-containing protein [Alkalibacterium kapii]|uniref:Membrane protein n=1 Tax=Alkalibacterium kapii TaxID=426704 RepID=A0A511AV89_9LACT|nr:DUF1538 domain-containing protein [Alkalibacterium kapii]GEK92115.1 membrane protein [Alkalibacterium kapii]